MAHLGGFDAEKTEPMQELTPLAEGDYLVRLDESEMKTTKDGQGEYLALTFVVMKGPYENRKLYANLNLKNRNDEAVRIARAELSALCRAVGVLQPQDSAELHNLPLTVKVAVEKRKDTGGLQNRIKAYRPKVAATAAVPAGDGQAPW